MSTTVSSQPCSLDEAERQALDLEVSGGAYPHPGYDELFHRDQTPRPASAALLKKIHQFSPGELQRCQTAAENSLRNLGITFNVYDNEAGTERVWPFDLIPRIVSAADWDHIERGLKQRILALNHFVQDVYNRQQILDDGIVPRELVLSASSYRPELRGFTPPQGVWCHISGVDLVRDERGTIHVLEDNLRCPSGVSYVLENRELMKRTFSPAFEGTSVRSIQDYPERLLQTLLQSCPPIRTHAPTAVVLTPGVYNSAYFEHAFLARQMGVELVQGSDLFVEDDVVWMNTTRGPRRVEVIYRRVDDDFLDPHCFRSDSRLGVAGLMNAYRAGNVSLANAPGGGVADDKAIYAYVPRIIRYYLNEEPILENVPTYLCDDATQRDYVFQHMDELVVKPTNESGGYGILMGPHATRSQREECKAAIQQNPRNYIAQPMLNLSTMPTLIEQGTLQPRHVDLRPFILFGEDIYVMPGGLTRVALRKGSLIVNSSQGGGSKDTWVEAPGGDDA